MAEESQQRGERKHSLERYVPKHRPEYNREYNDDDDNDGLDNLMDNMSLGRGRSDRGRRPEGDYRDDRGRGRRDERNGDSNGGLYDDGRGGWSQHQNGNPRNDNVNRRSDDGFDDHMAAKKEKMANSKPQHMADGNLPRPKKNTENFNPCHDPVEMRILVAQPGLTKYNKDYTNRDVLMVSDLYCQPQDLTIYDSLLKEIEESGIPTAQLFKLWHGDSHVIADDKMNWKEVCPTFMMVLDKIRDYFGMDIKATRMNWYRDSKEWKPFHHDAAAVKADKARNQNFTVAVSFGEERDAAFEHAKTKTKISMPQPNGTIYTFGRDINILWRHGILQVPPEKYVDKGRISIIAWGWIPQVEL